MASQGIQLPISLQISNLQEVANQMKQFASKNVLSDSLGGKKIESELNNIIKALAQIEARAKNAFKTQGDFSGLEKEINKIELSMEHVQTTFQNLDFKDLKIPSGVSSEMEALNASITALKNNFASFKAAQKDKLLSNVDFTGNLSKAFGKDAANMLTKNYDEMYKAIEQGMGRINAKLAAAKAEFEVNSQLITQNSQGKANFSAWGALDYINKAFATLPKDRSKWSEQQEMLSKYMGDLDENGQFQKFKSGGHANAFYLRIASMFDIPPAQMEEIRKKITDQVKKVQKVADDATAATVLRSVTKDKDLGAKIFGTNVNNYADLMASKSVYENQKKAADTSKGKVDAISPQADAAEAAFRNLAAAQQEVAAAQSELEIALKGPTDSLQQLQNAVVSSVANMPQLQQAFAQGAAEIYNLRQAADAGRQQLTQLDAALGKLSGVQNFINRYIGIYAIVRKVTQAIRSAFNNIKELDKNITNIAVVTNMSQADLWGKIGEYTAMAQQYGVATKDVYTVSQIFYQQGLQTSQVMSLTTETLKMAKIAGMDYSTAANAMTVAIRAFNIEMENAQSVTDTYSALAAKFAVSSAEIANAMEKTASSAANVGMSLQSTSAFISVMEQTTRESAQNIGSALKSIISRYGEMKASPSSLLNVDGEDVAFNKVDTALKSVGISIKDASGQFRDFDDVIMELAQKWNTLDNNTQRYIATVMAGNRQQSRFIALVSNYDELSRAMDVANNSQNASIVQTAKTMDSLESKAHQLKNAFAQIYLDIHVEDGLKNAYDWLTRILKTIGKLGMVKGVLPTLANVIGAGMGAKSLISTAKQGLIDQKSKIQKEVTLKDEQAKKQAEELNQLLEKEIVKKVTVSVDNSQMQVANALAEANTATLTGGLTGAYNMIAGTNSNITQDQFLGNIMGRWDKLTSDDTATAAAARKEILTDAGITENNKDFNALDAFLAKLAEAPNGIDILLTALNKASTAIDGLANAEKEGEQGFREGGTAARQGGEEIKSSSETASTSIRNTGAQFDRAGEGADNLNNSLNVPTPQLENLGLTSGDTANKLNQVGADAPPAADGLRQVANQAPGAAQALKTPLTNPSGGGDGGTTDTGFSWKKNKWGTGKARAIAGVASGVARLAGTAITAAGAAHEDKSTDTQETSKILTGVGNGLSMAGTGASMLGTLGPWGAVVGAIGGFLVGGLGSIIDGANMTLEEKLALQREEAKKASDEALKKEAKATDFSSQLDNLKTLKKHMYDSADSMQSYTEAMNTMGQQYPSLIAAYDSSNQAIIDLAAAEQQLLQIRADSAQAAKEAAIAEFRASETQQEIIDKFMDEFRGKFTGQTPMAYTKGGGYAKNVSPFLLAAQRGGEATSAISFSTVGTERDTAAGEMVLKVFEQLKNSDLVNNGTDLGEMLKFYQENPTATLTREDLLLITQYMLDNPASDGWHQGTNILQNGEEIFVSYDRTIGQKDVQQFHDSVSNFQNEFDYTVTDLEKELNKFLEDNAKELNITAPTGEYQGKWARAYFDWAAEGELTYEDISKGWEKLSKLTKGYSIKAESFGRTLMQTQAQSSIADRLVGSTGDRAQLISNSGSFSSLLARGLQNRADSLGENAAEWATREDNSDFLRAKDELTDSIFNWVNTLTDSQIKEFNAMSDQMDSYLSADTFINKFNITDPEIQQMVIDQFIQANKNNKERILKAIYEYDSSGHKTGQLNSNMRGLAKYNYDWTHDNGSQLETTTRNKAQDIADLINNDQIISKYADYFTTQLVEINDLAQNGYTELGRKRLDILHSFATNIKSFNNQETQNDLFSIVSGIKFNDDDSIVSAREAITDYGTKNNIDVSSILADLNNAAQNLVFNITTLANTLSAQVLTSAKAIDELLASAKQGFSLDKAIEELNKINAKSKDKQFSFDELFAYDAALGKYVFTNDGLMTAMAQEEKQLKDRADKLKETKDTEARLKRVIQHAPTIDDTDIFDDSEDMMAYIKAQGFYNPYDAEEYETLVNDFMTNDTYKVKNWKEFKKYIDDKYGKDSKEAQQAEEQYEAYQANKINQYYSNIDWGKLATGTDLFGTNKGIQTNLINEINERRKKLGQELLKTDADWEETINAYLDLQYGTDNEINALAPEEQEIKRKQKNAARLAILGAAKKAQSDQVTTAINELLAGSGQVLSDTTLVLLDNANQISNQGILNAGQEYIESAKKLYENHAKNLLSMAEKNNAYVAILQKAAEKNNNVITALSSGASLDISQLGEIFTKFDRELYQYYQNGEWTNGLEEAMRTDAFGKTTITNWNAFISAMGVQPGDDIVQTFEFRNAYSSYVDGLITLDTQTQNLIKSNYENAFSAITGWKPINFSQLAGNEKLVKQLTGENGEFASIENGILTIKDTVGYARRVSEYFALLSTISDKDLMEKTGLTKADVAKNWKNAQMVITESQDAWAGINESISGLTTENIATLVEKGGFNLTDLYNGIFIKIGDTYALRLKDYSEYLLKSMGANSYDELTSEQKAKFDKAYGGAQTAIISKIIGLDWNKVLTGKATKAEMDTFSSELEKSMASLGMKLSDFLTEDGALDVGRLEKDIKWRKNYGFLDSDVADQLIKNLEEQIGSARDSLLEEFAAESDLLTKGTNKQADMKKFAAEYGNGKTINELFEYDDLLQSYTLSTEGYIAYSEAQREKLAQLGLADEFIRNYLEQQAQQLVGNEMDIQGFITGADISDTSAAAQKLMVQIRDWYALQGQPILEANISTIMNQLTAGGEEAVALLKQFKGEYNVSSDELVAVYRASFNRLKEAAEQMETLAVNQIITGDLVNIISGLESYGFKINNLGDGTAVITAVGDMVAAYNAIYQKMKSSSEATTAELNTQFAKLLAESSKNQTAPVEALANAASMTYDALGQILANEGLLLEDVLKEAEKYGIQALGAGKVQIKDFARFAEQMGWDTNSAEYTAAFKAYNDALIKMDQETTSNIMDEVTNLKSAKVGDKLNLTYLWTSIQQGINAQLKSEDWHDYYDKAKSLEGQFSETAEETAQRFAQEASQYNKALEISFTSRLEEYGAEFKDGILTIKADANIGAIIAEIAQMASENANLLPDELATLADTVLEYIKSITNAIKSGISGSATNAEMQQLQEWATGQGLGKLDFTQTANGLKLSQQSAIELYNALRQVDDLQASLIFKELNASLAETNEHYKSLSSIEARIKELNIEIKKLQNNRESLNEVDQQKTDAKINQYRQELELAEQIKSVRSTEEDASFNFMSNKIPGAQNNPINYYNNWAQAFAKLSDALKQESTTHVNGKTVKNQGLIDYQDWYNIVTEMGNIAEIIGGDGIKFGNQIIKNAQDASKLIEAGAKALTVDSNGQVKVALSNISGLGLDIKNGAQETAANMDEGIRAYAQAQVDALDGMIAMLELIVAMEQLGDIDVEGNGIDFGDFFTESGDSLSEGWTNFVQYCKEQIEGGNEDLENALKGIKFKIGDKGFSFFDMLDWDVTDFKIAGEDENFAKIFPAMTEALVQAAKNGDWDLEHIGQSLMDILKSSGFDGTIPIEIGDITYYFSANGYTSINWQDADVQDILKDIEKEGELKGKTAQETLDGWIQAYTNQTIESKTALEYVLRVKRKVTIENGEVTSVTVGGKTYRGDDIDVAMQAAALEDWGFDMTNWVPEYITVNGKRTAKPASTTVYLGNIPVKVAYQVTDDGGGKPVYEYNGSTYDSEDALYKAEYAKYSGEYRYGTPLNFEQWKWITFNIPVKVQTKFVYTDDNGGPGREVNPAQDPKLQNILKDIVERGTENINDYIQHTVDNGDGTFTIDYRGYKFTFTAPNGAEQGLVDTAIAALGIDSSMALTISAGITNAFSTMNFGETMATAIGNALTAEGVPLDNLKINAEKVTADGDIKVEPIAEATGKITHLTVTAQTVDAEGNITGVEITGQLDGEPVKVVIDKESVKSDISEIQTALEALHGEVTVQVGQTGVDAVQQAINDIKGKTVKVHAVYAGGNVEATGNVGLAKARGTLMGELGPELFVSQGRYFIAGQNGPEMVDLADDAIVFNHLQTKSLLEKGMSKGRGRAVTNERNAVSFATGNVHGGPAMASASAALAELKKLRAQWQALASLSASDLAKKGGGGGGGGDLTPFIKQLERWYNWLQKIAQLEREINLEEAKRSKYATSFDRSGGKYAQSQKITLDNLKQEVAIQKNLNDEQEKYLKERIEKANNDGSPWRALYKFTDEGAFQYDTAGYAWLSELFGTDEHGKPKYTAEEQYNAIINKDKRFADYMLYDESGNKLDTTGNDWYATALQNFTNFMDSDKEEFEGLAESVNEGKISVEKLEQQRNEILKEMEDNQIAVEQKVLKAVEESRQREIDELQKQRDAIEKGNQALIDGLNNQLQKEQDMYNQQQETDELAKLQRQLAILQRSGGSAASIADLQDQIADKQQSMYFEAQQQQINALQEASDNELERLDHQIDIMQETLDFEKENGLLWNQVYTVLDGSAEEIANFIKTNTPEYWGKSATDLAQTLREDMFTIDKFKELQIIGGMEALIAMYNDSKDDEAAEEEKKRTNEEEAATAAAGGDTSVDTSGSSNGNGNSSGGEERYKVTYTIYDEKGFQTNWGGYGVGATEAAAKTAAEKLAKSKTHGSKYYSISYGKATKYKSGGLIDYTGPAWVDGNSSQPEGVLNAAQTEYLRKNLLSNRSDSFVGAVDDFFATLEADKRAMMALTSANKANDYASINIEHASVNLQVDKLANDYDAKRAANTIMQEMLHIASKSASNNSVGR